METTEQEVKVRARWHAEAEALNRQAPALQDGPICPLTKCLRVQQVMTKEVLLPPLLKHPNIVLTYMARAARVTGKTTDATEASSDQQEQAGGGGAHQSVTSEHTPLGAALAPLRR